MTASPTRVLFLCTGNSARSQIAEALLKTRGGPTYDVVSAGTQPKGVNPMTLRVLSGAGIDWSQARSKNVADLVGQSFDEVITVCDRARESCPYFPGAQLRHWAAIKTAQPEIEIVSLTSFIEEEKVTTALEAGATGYLLKDAEADEVASAVRAAHNGEVDLDAAVTRLLARRMRQKKAQPEPVEPLTDRELEVLSLLGRGTSNKEIATALLITERTARTHVSNILGKLGLSSRTQAALYAVERGLVTKL